MEKLDYLINYLIKENKNIQINNIPIDLELKKKILGNKFGSKYEKKAQIAGGVILIIIGLKILLEHLGIL